MKKVFFLLLLIFLTGCLSYEENLVVHKNGSATLTIQFKVARQIRQQMHLDEFFDQNYIRQLIPPGAEIQNLQIDTERVLNVLFLNLRIPDLKNSLKNINQERGLLGNVEFSLDQNGNYHYRRSLSNLQNKFRSALSSNTSSDRKIRTITNLLSRSFLNYRLETPLTILESNATKVEGKVLYWKIPVASLSGDSEVIMTATFRKPPTPLLMITLGVIGLALLGGLVFLLVIRLIRKRKALSSI